MEQAAFARSGDDEAGRATAAVVELTMMVAIENERSRFNAAMGLASQGYSDVCELPLAQPSQAAAT